MVVTREKLSLLLLTLGGSNLPVFILGEVLNILVCNADVCV